MIVAGLVDGNVGDNCNANDGRGKGWNYAGTPA